MREYRQAARDGAAKRLKNIESGEPHTKVDSSTWTPPAMEEAGKKTGMRPVSKRQYKSGGKVHGEHAKKRADRKARKDGGKAMPPVDRFLNRDDKKANDLRDGVKHVGGMKRGGRTHKAIGGMMPTGMPSIRPPVDPETAAKRAAARKLAELERTPASARMSSVKNYAATDAAKIARRAAMGLKKGGSTHKNSGGSLEQMLESEELNKEIQGKKHGGHVKGREHHANGKPVGIEEDYRPVKYGQEKLEYSDDDKQKVANLAKYGSMKGNPTASPDYPEKKRGGRASHPDVAEDKALIRKMVKPSARTGKAHGGEKWIQGAIKHPGSLHKSLHVPAGEKIPAKKLEKAAHSDNPKLAKKANLAKTLKRMHHAKGGEVFTGANYPHKVPGVTGDRIARKSGGRAKGKTHINIMIHPGQAGGMAPPPPSAMMPPPPPPSAPPMAGPPMGAPPMGGPPPGMFRGGRAMGGEPVHIIDNAAGGGLGRLEKIKAYGLK